MARRRNTFRRGKLSNRRRRSRPLRLELLETRHLLATFIVNCNSAETNCAEMTTLAGAIGEANVTPGPDRIEFALPGQGPHILTDIPPWITGPVIIDGTTQDPAAAEPQIVLDPKTPVHSVLHVFSGGTTIRGLAIVGNADAGIVLEYGGGNTIQGNFIGTNASGTAAGSLTVGIWLRASDGNAIGGTTASERNVISGCQADGINLQDSDSNVILGNYIGTDVTGEQPIRNEFVGVALRGSNQNVIGPGNIISGNTTGIKILKGYPYSQTEEQVLKPSRSNVVKGNFIGTNANDRQLANGIGIDMQDAVFNTIGGSQAAPGTCTGDCNVISGNQTGIRIEGQGSNKIQGNFIGLHRRGDGYFAQKQEVGIRIENSSNNSVGGRLPAERNYIGGNLVGVAVGSGSSNAILGNYIGTDVTGQVAMPNDTGIFLAAAENTYIGVTSDRQHRSTNLISGNETGVELLLAKNNVVEANFIGTDESGTKALPNDTGVLIKGGERNTIGGSHATQRNLISGNREVGVSLISDATRNSVMGNLIGTDESGNASLKDEQGNNVGSRFGIVLEDAKSNTIGGTADVTLGGACTGACNLISSNLEGGILIQASGSTGNTVAGNLIGTDANGTKPLKNNTFGVALIDGASDNTIGGTSQQARNVIAANTAFGVRIQDQDTTGNTVAGNFIGTDTTGRVAFSGAIQNVGIGISNSSDNTIGGSASGAANVIAGNQLTGIEITGNDATGNQVMANFVGIAADGSPLENKQGVTLLNGARDNTIGGSSVVANTGNCSGSCNVISGNHSFGVGILGKESTDNRVAGNMIGTNKDGGMLLGGVQGFGVIIRNAPQNHVGGFGTGNIISGNRTIGILIEGQDSTANEVHGNAIGVGHDGTTPIPNRIGVSVHNAYVNFIGDGDSRNCRGYANRISGNTDAGVQLEGGGSNVVVNNCIGVDYAGRGPGNGTGVAVLGGFEAIILKNVVGSNIGDGILVSENDGVVISGNDIGLDAVTKSLYYKSGGSGIAILNTNGTSITNNTISSGLHGIEVSGASMTTTIGDNFIRQAGGDGILVIGNQTRATSPDNTLIQFATIGEGHHDGIQVVGSFNTTVSESSIYGNLGAAIRCVNSKHLIVNATTIWDNGEEQISTGCESATPVDLSGASQSNSTVIEGMLHGTPNTVYDVEFYSGRPLNSPGAAEHEVYLGTKTVTTDDDGSVGFRATIDETVAVGQAISATVTGPEGSTSAFSSAVLVDPPLPTNHVEIGDIELLEGHAGTTLFEFPIIRKNAGSEDVTVRIDTQDGSATVTDGDYLPVENLSVTFDSDTPYVQTVQVPVNGELFVEENETFEVHLTNVSGATIGKAIGTGTIVNDDTPSLTISDATLSEGDGGNTTFEFTISLTGLIDDPVSVRVDTEDVTATTSDGDYSEIADQVVTFTPGGALNQTVSVNVIGDMKVESAETFTVNLSDVSGTHVWIADASGLGTILNDDRTFVSVNDVALTEGDTGLSPLEFTVALSHPSDRPVTVQVDTDDDTATEADNDYIPIQGTQLTFLPGEPLVQTVSVDTKGDRKVETDETFTLIVSLVEGESALVDDGVGMGTILNNDVTELTIDSVVRNEGTGAATAFEFLVSLTEPTDVPVSVEVNTSDGTATAADGDYVPVLGHVLTFLPGQPTTQAVTVEVIADSKVESGEAFSVTLSNPLGATISDAAAQGAIQNDDATSFSIDDVALLEGDSTRTNFDFTVSLTNPSDTAVSVQVDVADGTARADDDDFVSLVGLVLPFAPGQQTQTVSVEVLGDLRTEADETFTVGLLNATGTHVSISDSTGLGTILNNDPDDDLDGVSSKLEDLAPGAGDGNSNGTPDRIESDVASLPKAVDEHYVTYVADAGTFSNVSALADPAPSESPSGIAFPVGFFEYQINDVGPGGSATVTLMLPPGVIVDTFYKYGPEPGDTSDHFYEFTFDGTTGAEFFSDRVVVHLVDGARGDHDLSANGTILSSEAAGLVTGVDLAIVKLAAPDPVGQDQALTYSLTVTNHGPNMATGVTLTDTLPAGVSFVEAVSSRGTISEAGGVVTLEVDEIRVRHTVTASIVVTAPSIATQITNTATVAASEDELAPNDNTATVSTEVLEIGIIRGQKYEDRNGDGQHDDGEPGLNGFTIELVDPGSGSIVDTTVTRSIDLDGNGTIDPETERGLYAFQVFVAGTYEIREQVPAGFEQTFPGGGGGGAVTQRLSETDAGIGGDGWSLTSSISADGRFVAFASGAGNLVADDNNFVDDIFVHDRQTGTIERISVPDPATGQTESNSDSSAAWISANGQFVAFASWASNLVPGDTNNEQDIFVYDRLLGSIERVSTSAAGIQANGPSGKFELGRGPSLSADGRLVAFESYASNLVASDTNQATDVFVKDRSTGAIQRVSVNNAGEETGLAEFSHSPAISGDGNLVVFASMGSNLVTDDTNDALDIFVFDRRTNQIERVSVDNAGNESHDFGGDAKPAISGDGRIVAFDSYADDLVTGDTNNTADVFVKNLETGVLERVSVNSAGNEANGLFGSVRPSLSYDGRYVAFDTDADNLIPDDNNAGLDVFVYDRQTDQIERVSVDSDGNEATGGPGITFSIAASISADGSAVAFESNAPNLVAPDNNGARDVFVRSVEAPGDTHVVTIVPGDEVEGRDFGNRANFARDFGDAPDSYGTLSNSGGAVHLGDAAGLFLGASLDWEADGQPSADASGDDATGIDDEDGVIVHTPVAVGETAELTVVASAAGLLDAWVDFDGDQVFDHPAEQVFANQSLAAGDNLLSFAVPLSAQVGHTFARFRVSTSGNLSPQGEAADGEVEDLAVEIAGLDFGDAAAPYATSRIEDGARHALSAAGPRLGLSETDAESDGQAVADALGDDQLANDDEDGVVLSGMPSGNGALVPGEPFTASVTLLGAGFLNAWFDFNGNGNWDDPGEHIVVDHRFETDAPETAHFDLRVPEDAVPGFVVARYRVSSQVELGSLGLAVDGEVEDHLAEIAGTDFGDAPWPYRTLLGDNGPRHLIDPEGPFLGAAAPDAEADGIPQVSALGDDRDGADDEDGFVLLPTPGLGWPLLVPGAPLHAQIDASGSGFISLWIDFDSNGILNSDEEHVIVDAPIPSVGSLVVSCNDCVPDDASAGQTLARVRVSSLTGLGPLGPALDGEVEDHLVRIAQRDFGDAPAPYPTLLADDGARHVILSDSPRLGGTPDSDFDGIPHSQAAGDDQNVVDDEDGVTGFETPLAPGGMHQIVIDVTTITDEGSQPGLLNAWVDFNDDGDWGDADEQIFTDLALATGTHTLSFPVPADFARGTTTYARFRFSRAAGLSPAGQTVSGGDFDTIVDGEVEDYLVIAGVAGIDIEKRTGNEDADDPTGPLLPYGDPVTFTYEVVNTGNVALAGVAVTDDNGTPNDVADDFNPTFVSGDTNNNGRLDQEEIWIYTAEHTVTAGQHASLGTVTAMPVEPDGGTSPGFATVTDTDPSHHFGVELGIDIQKSTNGEDADASPGVYLNVGDTAQFQYVVTNTGNVPLAGVAVVDDQQDLVVTFSGGDSNGNNQLDPDEEWIYTSSTTVSAGGYSNIGLVTAYDTTQTLGEIQDEDPSNHFGVVGGIDIETTTNGEDADAATGPILAVGSTAEFEYTVTNTGTIALANVQVSDDRGTPVLFLRGDSDSDGELDVDETWIYLGSATVTEGQYANIGSVVAEDATGTLEEPVSDQDPSHHFGAMPAIEIEKSTNGEDADNTQGPLLVVGATANFEYRVTNVGNVPLIDVTVSDDQGVDVVFVSGDANENGALDFEETWIFTASAIVTPGPYTNVGTAHARDAAGALPGVVKNSDTSHHFGVLAAIDIEKSTNGQDADVAPGPSLAIGSLAEFAYVVTNAGNVALANIQVSDDQGIPVQLLGGDSDGDGKLDVDETWTYTGSVTVTAGQYANTGSVVAEDATGTLEEPVGDEDPSHHFGSSSGSISGYVYVDVNDNGVMDPQELGLPNVPVRIGSPVTRTVQTAADGSYQFSNLPPGLYSVCETQPLAFVDGIKTHGIPRMGSVHGDCFLDMELEAGAEARDYNFAERGLKAAYITKRMFLASSPSGAEQLEMIDINAGTTAVSLQSEADGILYAADAERSDGATIQLYDSDWMPAALRTEHGWLAAPIGEGVAYVLLAESNEAAKLEIALTEPSTVEGRLTYTNPSVATDVNGDSYTVPGDALLLINELNSGGARPLVGPNLSPYYLDVSQDGYLAPNDVLYVIHAIDPRGQTGDDESPAEGEAEMDRAFIDAEIVFPSFAMRFHDPRNREDASLEQQPILARESSPKAAGPPTKKGSSHNFASLPLVARPNMRARRAHLISFDSHPRVPDQSPRPAEAFDRPDAVSSVAIDLEDLLDLLAKDVASTLSGSAEK